MIKIYISNTFINKYLSITRRVKKESRVYNVHNIFLFICRAIIKFINTNLLLELLLDIVRHNTINKGFIKKMCRIKNDDIHEIHKRTVCFNKRLDDT